MKKSRRVGGTAGRIQGASDGFVKAINTPQYSALLQDFENEATLDCGCVLARLPDSATDVYIRFCGLHDGASDLRKMLEYVAYTFDRWVRNGIPVGPSGADRDTLAKIQALLKEAR